MRHGVGRGHADPFGATFLAKHKGRHAFLSVGLIGNEFNGRLVGEEMPLHVGPFRAESRLVAVLDVEKQGFGEERQVVEQRRIGILRTIGIGHEGTHVEPE